MYFCMCTDTRICTWLMGTHKHTCTQLHTRKHVYTHTDIYIKTQVHTHTRTFNTHTQPFQPSLVDNADVQTHPACMYARVLTQTHTYYTLTYPRKVILAAIRLFNYSFPYQFLPACAHRDLPFYFCKDIQVS